MENEIVKVEQMDIVKSDNVFNSQVDIAKRHPRNIMRILDNAIATVSRNEKVASSCGYTLPRGGKQIRGASVHLARIIAQFYGNLRVQVVAGDIAAATVNAKAIAFDLESNYAVEAEVTRKITDKMGKRYNEDMINTTMQAAMAIAERNAITKVIPQAIVDEVYDAAMKKLTGDLSDEQKLIAKRKETIDYFLKMYSANETDVLTYLGKQTTAQITPDDIVTLRGIVQSLKDGDATAEIVFPRLKKDEDKKANKDLIDE